MPILGGNVLTVDYGPYTQYDIKVSYVRDEGVRALPVAADTTTSAAAVECEVVRLFAPISYKVVTWVASRIGTVPILPTAEPENPNEVLFKTVVGTVNPEVQADGTTVKYSVAGEYWYIQKAPRAENTTTLGMGANPSIDRSRDDNTIPPGSFETGILPT